jgi:DNA integrity scanning protein DisA with diadenylate cyclase activity
MAVTKVVTEQLNAQQEASTTHVNTHITTYERIKFYSGEDRASIQLNSLQQVRTLECANDDLQRQITHLKSDTVDPLKTLADIDHCNAMIARNTGEILNVYAQNEKRLARINELEKQNINLQQEISDTQAAFGSSHDQDLKIKYASEYFGAKSSYDGNLVEIQELKVE